MKFLWMCVLLSLTLAVPAQTWKQKLKTALPLLGHRNWVVVVDSAYPFQTSAGLDTVVTGEDQLTVVKAVLAEIRKQKHVRPVIFLDKELKFVPNSAARGIDKYRSDLAAILKGSDPTSMLHEDIIKTLDEAGKSFHVLVLKTNLTLPYTSVFFRLDCGYWSAANETAMRKKMGGQ